MKTASAFASAFPKYYRYNGAILFVIEKHHLQKKWIMYTTGASTPTCFLPNNTFVSKILCVDF